jgi:hypothetical protein
LQHAPEVQHLFSQQQGFERVQADSAGLTSRKNVTNKTNNKSFDLGF